LGPNSIVAAAVLLLIAVAALVVVAVVAVVLIAEVGAVVAAVAAVASGGVSRRNWIACSTSMRMQAACGLTKTASCSYGWLVYSNGVVINLRSRK
jgi:hypothetical protein